MTQLLVSTAWLAERLGSADLVVLDASYHLAPTGRDAAAEFAAGHVPGARFLDLASLNDPSAPFDNTVPTAEQFQQHVRAVGVSEDSHVVLYDDSPLKSAARGWFLFTLFGARNVSILDGGLAKWKAEGRPETRDMAEPAGGDFTASFRPELLRDKQAVLASLGGEQQIVDARGAGRFTADEPEPRPGMASGHIPGARNLPIGMLYEADGTMKDPAGIEAEFVAAGVDVERPVITSCGSGVTAAVLSLALARLGKRDVALYDGSWSEWGSDLDTPKATGPAKSGEQGGAPRLD
ncbi:3-mercaptopyruvate sulfurtransferase [Croceicoccus marinus]|jgi:thiosulfate/3-mercaptopyruvate sulfurtransferase|uniref:Sulfurtransferase n=1 Tax=Croceicoccus marinus TaxID=450378 RepID=A0A7G6VX59_9SPHN|nr:3-mercaptopyruvate sulfurtransferase [Croceicoccus marinus]QNE06324.1 3-mercaptopyruvate sulfurtransferase [Croceicoccus marinus]